MNLPSTQDLWVKVEAARAKRDGRAAENLATEISFGIAEDEYCIVLVIPPTCPPEQVRQAYKEARAKYYPIERRTKPLGAKMAAFVSYAIESEVNPDDLSGSCNVSQLVDNFNLTDWVVNGDLDPINAAERRRLTNTWRRCINSIDRFRRNST